METQIRRWGNSLGILVPKAVATAAGLKEGDRLTIQAVDEGFSVRRARRRYALDELLARMPAGYDPEHPDEIDFGTAGEELL